MALPCTLGDAHGVSLTGRQRWLPGLGTHSSCGVNARSSCSSSFSFNIKENKVIKRKKFKAVPDDWLPGRFKLQKPGSKLWPHLVLLVQTLQLCFCWIDLLPFPTSHCSTSPVLLSFPTMEKIPTCRYQGEIWQQQCWSCLKWPEVMPGFLWCLPCLWHYIGGVEV